MGFLFAAFAITWLVFFAYAFFVSRRRQELEREFDDRWRDLLQDDAPFEEDA